MEGAGGGRKPSLEVLRDFTCSRLEKQVLIRAYEFAVPVIRRNTVGERRAHDADGRVEFDRALHHMARGA